MDHCTRRTGQQRIQLAPLRLAHWSSIVSVLSRSPCCLELSQFELCTNACCVGRLVQHVRYAPYTTPKLITASLTLSQCRLATSLVRTYIVRDRPYYIRGNKILLAICCFNIILFPTVKYYYISRNKRRQEAWIKMTGEEQVDHVSTTKDEGAKRLDFRFAR